MSIPSDDLRRVSIDSLVTKLKLSSGSTLVIHGKTTPEQMPYVFLLAVDRHNQGLTNQVIDFANSAPMIERRDNTESWAVAHRAELQAKRELGVDAPSRDLIARMLALMDEWESPPPDTKQEP